MLFEYAKATEFIQLDIGPLVCAKFLLYLISKMEIIDKSSSPL